ncbi:MAG: hypothetical protein NC907_01495 [Candidatus Omnitrophica bacterium]|nr:hypothetical protein [Candidatus Omnitrophota bacterium]
MRNPSGMTAQKTCVSPVLVDIRLCIYYQRSGMDENALFHKMEPAF